MGACHGKEAANKPKQPLLETHQSNAIRKTSSQHKPKTVSHSTTPTQNKVAGPLKQDIGESIKAFDQWLNKNAYKEKPRKMEDKEMLGIFFPTKKRFDAPPPPSYFNTYERAAWRDREQANLALKNKSACGEEHHYTWKFFESLDGPKWKEDRELCQHFFRSY